MYSSSSLNLEGADYIYASAFPDDADNTFSISISSIGHGLTIHSISPENLAIIADVVNRALATNASASTIDNL